MPSSRLAERWVWRLVRVRVRDRVGVRVRVRARAGVRGGCGTALDRRHQGEQARTDGVGVLLLREHLEG